MYHIQYEYKHECILYNILFVFILNIFYIHILYIWYMFYVHLLYNVYIIIEYLLCKEHILYLSVYKYFNMCLCVCLPTVQSQPCDCTLFIIPEALLQSSYSASGVSIPCSNICSQRLDSTLAANSSALSWHQLRTVSGGYSVFQPALGDRQIRPWALSWRVKNFCGYQSFLCSAS